jgi:hypothetical protein
MKAQTVTSLFVATLFAINVNAQDKYYVGMTGYTDNACTTEKKETDGSNSNKGVLEVAAACTPYKEEYALFMKDMMGFTVSTATAYATAKGNDPSLDEEEFKKNAMPKAMKAVKTTDVAVTFYSDATCATAFAADASQDKTWTLDTCHTISMGGFAPDLYLKYVLSDKAAFDAQEKKENGEETSNATALKFVAVTALALLAN